MYFHQNKINSVRFEEPYKQTNSMDNTNNNIRCIGAHKEYIKEDTEEEELFEDTNEYTINES